jgi:hypothetical protein
MFFLLQQAPLWVIVIILATVLAGSLELTFRLCRHFYKANGQDKTEAAGYLLSAVLGLLALLLGFTFSMALDRYDSRRILVVEEANAISASYLQAQLLDEPYRTQLTPLFKRYIKTRLDYFTGGKSYEYSNLAYQETLVVEDALWPIITKAVRTMENHDYTSVVASSMNRMFDLAASRRAAIAAQIPTSVLEMIIGYAMVSAITIGYVLSVTNQRHLVISTILLILVACVIALIIDLDRPLYGTIRVSYEPLNIVAHQINQH